MQCEDIVDARMDEGYRADALHGDKSQQARSRTMDWFRKGRIKILVATDVAARGLDVKDIDTVINFDFPLGSDGVENYVHRIGRTARGDAKGTAYTFVTMSDRDRVNELIKVLKSCDQNVPDELEALRPRAPPQQPRNSRYSRHGNYHRNRDRGDKNFRGSHRFDRNQSRGGWKDSFNRRDNRRRTDRFDYGADDYFDSGSRKKNYSIDRSSSYRRRD